VTPVCVTGNSFSVSIVIIIETVSHQTLYDLLLKASRLTIVGSEAFFELMGV